jgi:hypothetical protein
MGTVTNTRMQLAPEAPIREDSQANQKAMFKLATQAPNTDRSLLTRFLRSAEVEARSKEKCIRLVRSISWALTEAIPELR